MSKAKTILLRIHNAYYMSLFLSAYLWLFPIYFVVLQFWKQRWALNLTHNLNTLWAFMFTIPGGTWMRADGKKKLDKSKVYIFASNHTSYLDIPACNVGIPNQFRYLAKTELGKIPLFGFMYKRYCILVNRKDPADRRKALGRTQKALDEGTSVLFFPEGTIIKDPNKLLGEFRDGAFRQAIENKLPVVPITILGARDVLPDDKKWLLTPGPIKVKIDDPIDTSNLTMEDVPQLRNQVRGIIVANLEDYYGRKE